VQRPAPELAWAPVVSIDDGHASASGAFLGNSELFQWHNGRGRPVWKSGDCRLWACTVLPGEKDAGVPDRDLCLRKGPFDGE
jgi:hypothetical protein